MCVRAREGDARDVNKCAWSRTPWSLWDDVISGAGKIPMSKCMLGWEAGRMTSMDATIMIMRRPARTLLGLDLSGAPGGCGGKRARYKGRAQRCASADTVECRLRRNMLCWRTLLLALALVHAALASGIPMWEFLDRTEKVGAHEYFLEFSRLASVIIFRPPKILNLF